MDFIITEKPATICLNMIVKNEAHIILNTLTKLCDKIKFDYWVICDTGSTDKTPTIITEFFEKRGIKGELFFDEWVNFAHNRTLALERAYKKTDLLLVFDADDEICGNITIPKEVLHDEYQLKFGSNEGVAYIRVLLVNNHKKFEYKSVVHEFICSKEPNSRVALIDGDYYVVSGRAGSRNKDPEKYLKDAQILEKAYAEAVKTGDLLFHRYAFYCANSYKDYGDTEQAIKWYKIVLSHEGQWAQEKYMSCLYLGENYEKLQQKETGFFYLIKAFQYDTERVECLFPLLVHYCCENMNQVAYNFYLNVKEFYENQYLNTNMSPTKLFLVPDKYNFFVPYYMILIGDKVKDFKCVIRMFEIVFIKKQRMFVEFFVKNLLYNLQFFFKHVSKENTQFISLANDYIRFLYDNNVPLHSFDYLLNDVYKNAGIITDYLFVKEVTNKPSIFSEEECAQSKNVLIYTGFCDLNWNYSYALTNALGGSEKAVAYLTQHLSKDYTIYVSGSVKEETIDNIHYVPLNELTKLINTLPFHTVIVSRYVAFYEMFPQCSFYQSYIWAHDTMLIPFGINTTLNEEQIVKKWNKYIKGCVCLTEWHKNVFLERYSSLKNKIHLINNGIEVSHFCKEDAIPNANRFKVANRFIYTSRPDRGLNILVALWPSILEKLPNATLVVSCYGEFPSNQTETDIKETMDKYDSIQFLGKLDATQLYEEMARAEYWLYPTSWPETSCITALEMLMSEVICIYYPVAGLTNTLGRYGIQVLPEKEIDAIVSLTEDKKSNIRKEGRLYAESCSWANRGKIWNRLLGLINDDNDLLENIDDKITKVETETETETETEEWLFFLPHFYTSENLIDYFDSLSSKYNVKYTADKEYACSLNPSRILFVFEIADTDVYNHFYNKNTEICIFNSEPLNLIHRIENLKNNIKLYNANKIYDYSLSNINILNECGYQNTIHLPYLIYDEENSLLKVLNKNTKKIYDFGIILDEKIYLERRSKVVDFLVINNYSVKVIHGWKETRDKQLAECNIILNIHGHNYGEASNIFEHIRCDRLLAAGFQVLSEDSLYLDKDFKNIYPNLKMINYDDFFNLETYTQTVTKKKIIDCFIFYNELDMLEYRLNVLDDVVDYFVLVEANQTFVGKSKQLFYNDNTHLFEKFNKKIIHIICDLPFSRETIDISKNQQWINEKYNRNCIKDGLKQINMNEHDLIIISDVDEIPDPNTLNKIKTLDATNKIMVLEQDFYYYNLNSKRNEKCYFSKILSYDKYKTLNITCDDIRNSTGEIVQKGGWHLSYFGDAYFIKNKIENFSHQEYNSVEFTELANIEDRINNCLDMFNRHGNNGMYKISVIDNDYLPPLYNIFLKEFYENPNEEMRQQKLLQFLKHHYYDSAWKGHFEFSMWLVKKMNPRIIVELGVDYGHSSFCLASPNIGHVYGIDCFEGDIHTGFRNNEQIVRDVKRVLLHKSLLLSDNITFVKGYFDDVLSTFNHEIDILHIDGLHTYEAVKNDFTTWITKTTENSVIIIHDVVSFPYTVGRFFNEIDFPKFHFTHSAGLGVVCKNKTVLEDLINSVINSEMPCIDNLVYEGLPKYAFPYTVINSTVYQHINKPFDNLCISNPIYCVIHSCTFQTNGTAKLDYIIDKIIKSGFLGIVDKIIINNIGLPIQNKYGDKFNVNNYSENTLLYENPTLNKIKELAVNSTNSYILYLHTKGNSYSHETQQIKDWTNMMLYFLVEKYTVCIDKLNSDYDTIGCNYNECVNEIPSHYSGNFWWSKSDYIRSLPLLDETNPSKTEPEFWLFKNNPKAYAAHSSKVNHYFETYSQDKYRF